MSEAGPEIKEIVIKKENREYETPGIDKYLVAT
jgi:hypothetical protein